MKIGHLVYYKNDPPLFGVGKVESIEGSIVRVGFEDSIEPFQKNELARVIQINTNIVTFAMIGTGTAILIYLLLTKYETQK